MTKGTVELGDVQTILPLLMMFSRQSRQCRCLSTVLVTFSYQGHHRALTQRGHILGCHSSNKREEAWLEDTALGMMKCQLAILSLNPFSASSAEALTHYQQQERTAVLRQQTFLINYNNKSKSFDVVKYYRVTWTLQFDISHLEKNCNIPKQIWTKLKVIDFHRKLFSSHLRLINNEEWKFFYFFNWKYNERRNRQSSSILYRAWIYFQFLVWPQHTIENVKGNMKMPSY